MTWHIVCLNDVLPTPWRNGNGVTRELVAWPDSLAWQWRASVAEVVQSGPFSSFAGVQRWFAVLQGDGVCLTVDGEQHYLSKRASPLAFDGAAETTCDLLGGATQDFNLMTHSSSTARMLRVCGDFRTITRTSKIIAVYTHSERAIVQIGTEVYGLSQHEFGWIHADANMAIQVLGNDALLMEIDL